VKKTKEVKVDTQGRVSIGTLADHEWYKASADEAGVITLVQLQLVPVGVLRNPSVPLPRPLAGTVTR
jgi:hypothetical protein